MPGTQVNLVRDPVERAACKRSAGAGVDATGAVHCRGRRWDPYSAWTHRTALCLPQSPPQTTSTHKTGHTRDTGQRLWNTPPSRASPSGPLPLGGALRPRSRRLSPRDHICADTIRLVGGPNASSGRVEVWHKREWGTVCNDSWDDADAAVVCRMLGYSGGVQMHSRFTTGTGKIWLDEVECEGTESDLAQCKHAGWGEHNCDHNEDAAVTCTAGQTATVALGRARAEREDAGQPGSYFCIAVLSGSLRRTKSDIGRGALFRPAPAFAGLMGAEWDVQQPNRHFLAQPFHPQQR